MPTYDNATPQGNDQIATTQPLILGNFEFIPLAIGQEHNFDPTDPAKTYHKQASMPNEADPVALPAGTDGIYYVNGGAPKFKNASGSFFLSTSSVAFSGFSGTLTINPTTTVNIPGLTGDLGGYINVNRGGNSDGTFDIAAFFQNAAAVLQGVVHLSENGNNTPYVVWNGTNLAIKNASSSIRTFHYFGWITPVI